MKFQVKIWRKIGAPPEFKEVSFTFYTWEEVKTALNIFYTLREDLGVYQIYIIFEKE
jgi:hypothetical protein